MKLHNSIRVAGLFLLVVGFCSTADAQRYPGAGGRWEYLGQSRVDGNNDHDNISVGRNDGRFRAIQLRVQNAPIEFQRVVVHYENGADHEVEVRDRIRAGGRTRVLDLPGDRRVIRSVELWYARANYRSRRPVLRLYGLR